MSVEGAGARVVIRRRWLRPKHWFLLVLFAAAAAYVAYLWTTVEASAWLVIGTVFVVMWNFSTAAMFLNSTVVTADANSVTVRHGPFPSLFARRAAVTKPHLEQLYSAKYGALFAVMAKLTSGQSLTLVAPLITAEQALFVEQELERALGLVDFAVEGELGTEGGTSSMQGKSPKGAASGAALTFVIPALIASIVGLFLFIAGTDVSGRLQAGGALGSWTFEPDDCVSGQREGFGGVVLNSSAHRERVVRIVRDPVRGGLIVVASAGRPNHVLSGESCKRLDVAVERTNTNINDIWAVDGSVTLECNDLSGSVVFKGCH